MKEPVTIIGTMAPNIIEKLKREICELPPKSLSF